MGGGGSIERGSANLTQIFRHVASQISKAMV